MTKHEASHLLGRLYMNDVVTLSQLMQLTARLENPAECRNAINTIQKKSKKLLK